MPQMTERDKKAALELIAADSVLKDDEYTMAVVRRGGITLEGKSVGDLGDFLDARRLALIKNPDPVSLSRRVKEAMAFDSEPNEREKLE